MKRILLVEDEEVLSEVVKGALEQKGYEVDVAEDGEVGLQKAKQGGYDLILLDIIMPTMNGFEVMEEIQKDEEMAKTPIIVVSNSGQPVEVDRAKELGASDWLLKTEFDPEEVVKKVINQIGEA